MTFLVSFLYMITVPRPFIYYLSVLCVSIAVQISSIDFFCFFTWLFTCSMRQVSEMVEPACTWWAPRPGITARGATTSSLTRWDAKPSPVDTWGGRKTVSMILFG